MFLATLLPTLSQRRHNPFCSTPCTAKGQCRECLALPNGSRNLPAGPNAPGRFIVWYRNETTMLVLWQPPYPAGIYSHYRVRLDANFLFELSQGF